MKHCFPIMQYVSVLKPYNCDLSLQSASKLSGLTKEKKVMLDTTIFGL